MNMGARFPSRSIRNYDKIFPNKFASNSFTSASIVSLQNFSPAFYDFCTVPGRRKRDDFMRGRIEHQHAYREKKQQRFLVGPRPTEPGLWLRARLGRVRKVIHQIFPPVSKT